MAAEPSGTVGSSTFGCHSPSPGNIVPQPLAASQTSSLSLPLPLLAVELAKKIQVPADSGMLTSSTVSPGHDSLSTESVGTCALSQNIDVTESFPKAASIIRTSALIRGNMPTSSVPSISRASNALETTLLSAETSNGTSCGMKGVAYNPQVGNPPVRDNPKPNPAHLPMSYFPTVNFAPKPTSVVNTSASNTSPLWKARRLVSDDIKDEAGNNKPVHLESNHRALTPPRVVSEQLRSTSAYSSPKCTERPCRSSNFLSSPISCRGSDSSSPIELIAPTSPIYDCSPASSRACISMSQSHPYSHFYSHRPDDNDFGVGSSVEVIVESGSTAEGHVVGLPDENGLWAVQCHIDPRGKLRYIPVSAVRPLMCRSLVPGSGVEVLHDGIWYSGYVVALPIDDVGKLSRWTVKCHSDPESVLTYSNQEAIRPLLSKREKKTLLASLRRARLEAEAQAEEAVSQLKRVRSVSVGARERRAETAPLADDIRAEAALGVVAVEETLANDGSRLQTIGSDEDYWQTTGNSGSPIETVGFDRARLERAGKDVLNREMVTMVPQILPSSVESSSQRRFDSDDMAMGSTAKLCDCSHHDVGVESLVHIRGSPQAGLDAEWTRDGQKVASILDTTLTALDGIQRTIRKDVTGKKFIMQFKGAELMAELQDDGKLHWCDGDLWERQEQVRVAQHPHDDLSAQLREPTALNTPSWRNRCGCFSMCCYPHCLPRNRQ